MNFLLHSDKLLPFLQNVSVTSSLYTVKQQEVYTCKHNWVLDTKQPRQRGVKHLF